MAWKVKFSRSAERELAKLDPQNVRRILAFLHDRLLKIDDPRTLGEALKGSSLGAFWKYRVGDFRLIASIEDQELCIMVVRVGHRREVYRF